MDVANVFMFRGIRQNTNGIVMWPAAELTIIKPARSGVLNGVGVAVSTWNSLHTDETGLDGPSGSLWYESDFAVTFGVAFRRGFTLSTTYNLYTSPNDSFATAKEIMFELAIDDSPYLAKGALKPTVTFARELDTEPGVGQADDGEKAGTYFEIGIAPEYSMPRATLAMPVKVGLSLSHYYELEGVDTTFGFFSIGGLVTVPIGTATKAGAWNIRGGVELQRLGDATTSFNDDRRFARSRRSASGSSTDVRARRKRARDHTRRSRPGCWTGSRCLSAARASLTS